MGCFLWLCLLIRIIIYAVAWWGVDHRLMFCLIHLSSNKPKISSFKTLPRSCFLKWGQWEVRVLEKKKVGHATWIIKKLLRRGKINIPFYLGLMLNPSFSPSVHSSCYINRHAWGRFHFISLSWKNDSSCQFMLVDMFMDMLMMLPSCTMIPLNAESACAAVFLKRLLQRAACLTDLRCSADSPRTYTH